MNRNAKFPKKNLIVGFVTAATLLFCVFLTGCRKETHAKPENVILIVVDALRYDHMSFTGYGRKTTPVIDALTEKAALSMNAYSQANWTCPSMASIFSGTYPFVHKVYNKPENIEGSINVIPEKLILLSEWFKHQGFLTKGITALGWVSPKTNYEGFDEFLLCGRDDEEITFHAGQFIRKNKDRAFFLYLHYLDLHDYFWPKYKEGRFIKTNYDLSPEFSQLLERKPREILYRLKRLEPGYRFHKADFQYLLDKYDSLLYRNDELIGRIVSTLEEEGRMEETLIIITADHGERFYEHNMMGHGGPGLYNEVVRIPLIFHCRKMFSRTRLINGLAESIDIYPTLVDIFDTPKVRVEGMDQLQGTSLFGNRRDKVVFIENSALDRVKIVEGEWSYIHHFRKRKGELYHLMDDPFEKNDLADEKPNVVRRMVKLFMKKIEKWRQLSEAMGAETSAFDEKTRDKLRSLGYIK